jgi:hypothetical protein
LAVNFVTELLCPRTENVKSLINLCFEIKLQQVHQQP